MSQTMLMFKPDTMSDGLFTVLPLVGGGLWPDKWQLPVTPDFRLQSAIVTVLTDVEAEDLYVQHKDRDFYDRLIRFTLGGSVCVSVWSGHEAWLTGREKVVAIRKILKCEDPAVTGPRNAIHASDSPDAALREVEWATRIMRGQWSPFSL